MCFQRESPNAVLLRLHNDTTTLKGGGLIQWQHIVCESWDCHGQRLTVKLGNPLNGKSALPTRSRATQQVTTVHPTEYEKTPRLAEATFARLVFFDH